MPNFTSFAITVVKKHQSMTAAACFIFDWYWFTLEGMCIYVLKFIFFRGWCMCVNVCTEQKMTLCSFMFYVEFFLKLYWCVGSISLSTCMMSAGVSLRNDTDFCCGCRACELLLSILRCAGGASVTA